jgi:hypothetical protein
VFDAILEAMDAVEKMAWRQVLRELHELEAEYERVAREKTEHCSSRNAAEQPETLIEIK